MAWQTVRNRCNSLYYINNLFIAFDIIMMYMLIFRALEGEKICHIL